MADDTKSPRPVAVIAGATGNVGLAAARALAKRGYQVVMLGRSLERLNDRIRTITTDAAGNDRDLADALIAMEVDLTDLDSIRTVVGAITNRFDAIDVLVLSAVTIRQDGPTLLPDGNEVMFSTNVLGPFRLALLLRLALEAAGGTVVHVVAPFHSELDWDDLQSVQNHEPMVAYERSKTCHRALAGEMARRFAPRVSSVAFDPGFVIARDDPYLKSRWPGGLTGLMWRVYAFVAAKRPVVAGQAMARLLTNPNADLNGAYYELGIRRMKADPAMRDEDLGRRLWDALEALAFPESGA